MIRKNYIPVKIPTKWTSAYQPITFIYDTPIEEGLLYNHNSEGYLSVWSGLFMDLDVPLSKGSLVYITSGTYKGYHVVKTILGYGYSGLVKTSIFYQTETKYTTSTGGTLFDVKLATPPVWNIYAGYQDSEISSPNPFPYTHVSEIQPEGNANGYIEFNISGYVQSALNRISPPAQPDLTGEVIDYNLFMPYRVCTPIAFDYLLFAINASIPSEELNKKYIDSNVPLNSRKVEFAIGTSFDSYIYEEQVITKIKIN